MQKHEGPPQRPGDKSWDMTYKVLIVLAAVIVLTAVSFIKLSF